MTKTEIKLTKVKNDINGNPRYVVHFLNLLSEQEQKHLKDIGYSLDNLYDVALRKAKLIGGSKYRGKDFGGGIVFQSYNTNDLTSDIERFAKDKELIEWLSGMDCNLGINKFSRSKEKLSYDNDGNVYSYVTHVAKVIGGMLVTRDRYYSVTTSNHISIAARELGLRCVNEFEYYNRYQ